MSRYDVPDGDGGIVRPLENAPERELIVWENPELRASLARGLAESAAGALHDLGSVGHPTVLDLDDPYFDGQTLPDALTDYEHVHSVTGICVKNANGPFCEPGDER